MPSTVLTMTMLLPWLLLLAVLTPSLTVQAPCSAPTFDTGDTWFVADHSQWVYIDMCRYQCQCRYEGRYK